MHRKRNTRQLSAAQLLSDGQIGVLLVAIAVLLATTVVGYTSHRWQLPFQIMVVGITTFYLLFVGLKFAVSAAASRHEELSAFYDSLPLLHVDALPYYTEFLMLVREPEEVVYQLIQAACDLQYPSYKRCTMLVVERHDKKTQAIVDSFDLPDHFMIVRVPDVGPRTKPKAFNYAWELAMQDPNLSKGLCVVYDAEDRMPVDQLHRAATIFDYLQTQNGHRPVGCLQGRLTFWNPRASMVATFSWAEYSVHFYRMLPGLARLDLVPPLGGTSNHFRMHMLAEIARRKGKWRFKDAEGGSIVVHEGPMDPYCLTEDSLLGADIYRAGWRVELFNSVTFEEAPQYALAATKQRTRWVQGWLQSGLVQTREPLRAMSEMGPVRWFCYNLFMLGTPFSLVINPIMWALTATYFVAKVLGVTAVTSYIQALYPGPVFYAAVLVMVAGNLVLWYQKLLTPLRRQERGEAVPLGAPLHPMEKRQRSEEYGLAIRLLSTPLWWGFTSIAGYRAFMRVLKRSTRSAWDKTEHGNALHLENQLLGGIPKQLTTEQHTPSSAGLSTPLQGAWEEA